MTEQRVPSRQQIRVSNKARMTVNKAAPAPESPTLNADSPSKENTYIPYDLISNASLMRSQLISSLLHPGLDINKECRYPDVITPAMYNQMYERQGVAKKVVHAFPKETWKVPPEIIETEDDTETPFEKSWNAQLKKFNLWSVLHRADALSGIGRFGVILLGLDDGAELNLPIPGFETETYKPNYKPSKKYKLLYVRVFDESVTTVSTTVTDRTNPRYGLPEMYCLNFFDEATGASVSSQVHWSRVIHIADERRMSEIFGTPRMKEVYNRLLDLNKILSGSGEMFWRGAFPGYSFEVNPDQRDVTIDTEKMREEFSNYANGMQRYLALSGVSAKSLSPQVADPSAHVQVQLDNIAITMNIPKRILFGSEQAQLASEQDTRNWNTRVAGRQSGYVTPYIIKPFVLRLIELGCVDSPKEIDDLTEEPTFLTNWEDLNTATAIEKADVSSKITECMSKYVAGQVETFCPPMEYLTLVLGFDDEKAKAIIDSANKHNEELDLEEEETRRKMSEQGLTPEGLPIQDPNIDPEEEADPDATEEEPADDTEQK